VAACSGLLTLPVVVINKGSCKTLGRQRTERRAPCFTLPAGQWRRWDLLPTNAAAALLSTEKS